MGTIVTVTVVGENARHCHHAIDAVFTEMRTIDRLMTVFDERSQVSSINSTAGKSSVVVDQRLIEVLDAYLHYNVLTGGRFDVTLGPLMELWGFRNGHRERPPSDREIQNALEATGSQVVTTDRAHSSIGLLKEGASLDLGGIAVGYSVDRAVRILRDHGIETGLIDHSGDIYAMGSPPDADGWIIGIADPQRPERIITSLRIRDKALSTSGNYENFVVYEGNRYGHIIDPETGRPSSRVLSMTIVSDSSLEADALSTGAFVMGVEKACDLVRSDRNFNLVAIVEKEGHEEVISTF